MGIYFYKLFDLTARRGLKKGELTKLANISKVTMSKLVKNQVVQTDTINKICTALECQPGDIMEWIADDAEIPIKQNDVSDNGER